MSMDHDHSREDIGAGERIGEELPLEDESRANRDVPASEAGGEQPHPLYPGRKRNGQCRKGFTPNRKGRPRRARSTRAVFQEMLHSKVPMKIDGRVQMLTVTEALAARVKKESLTGPLGALEKGIRVAQMYSLPELIEQEAKMNFDLLTDEEFVTYGKLVYKLRGMDWDSERGSSVPGQASSETYPVSQDGEP